MPLVWQLPGWRLLLVAGGENFPKNSDQDNYLAHHHCPWFESASTQFYGVILRRLPLMAFIEPSVENLVSPAS